MVNVPAELVVALLTIPVASFVTVTLASGTTAPVGSVTVPVTPLRPWAWRPAGQESNKRHAARPSESQTGRVLWNVEFPKSRKFFISCPLRGCCEPMTRTPLAASQTFPGSLGHLGSRVNALECHLYVPIQLIDIPWVMEFDSCVTSAFCKGVGRE